jgi:hypothetical protein
LDFLRRRGTGYDKHSCLVRHAIHLGRPCRPRTDRSRPTTYCGWPVVNDQRAASSGSRAGLRTCRPDTAPLALTPATSRARIRPVSRPACHSRSRTVPERSGIAAADVGIGAPSDHQLQLSALRLKVYRVIVRQTNGASSLSWRRRADPRGSVMADLRQALDSVARIPGQMPLSALPAAEPVAAVDDQTPRDGRPRRPRGLRRHAGGLSHASRHTSTDTADPDATVAAKAVYADLATARSGKTMAVAGVITTCAGRRRPTRSRRPEGVHGRERVPDGSAEPPGSPRRLRAEARLTQQELAKTAGVSPRSVSDLERGINRTAATTLRCSCGAMWRIGGNTFGYAPK